MIHANNMVQQIEKEKLNVKQIRIIKIKYTKIYNSQGREEQRDIKYHIYPQRYSPILFDSTCFVCVIIFYFLNIFIALVSVATVDTY